MSWELRTFVAHEIFKEHKEEDIKPIFEQRIKYNQSLASFPRQALNS